MKCQLILTIWIVCFFHQIHSKALSDIVYPNKDDSNTKTPNLGNNDPATDQSEYDDEYQPPEDGGELADDTDDTDRESHSDEATASVVAKGVASSDEKLPLDEPKKSEKKNSSSNKNVPEGKASNSSTKETSSQAVNEPHKTAAGESPKEAEKNPTPQSPEIKKKPEERLPPDQKADKKLPKPSAEKAKVTSPKQSEGENSTVKKPEQKGAVSPKPNQQDIKGASSDGKSKWQKAKGVMLITPNPKSNYPKRPLKTPNEVKGNLDRTQPHQKKRDVGSPTSTAPIDENVTEYVGSISDLLSSIGKRMDAFEDVNKKSRPIEGRQLTRDVGVSARSVAPQLGTKSLPVAEEKQPSRGWSYDLDERSSFSTQISPFAKRKEAERLRKLYGTTQNSLPPSKTPSGGKTETPKMSPKSKTGARSVSPSVNSGTEDYEKFLARRGRQLDEMEAPKPVVATKSLPQRLTTMSGTFESIASQLDSNIKSVSAVNKDKSSRRASKPPTKINARDSNLIHDEEDDTSVTARAGNNCPCYNKYSPLNVVRRTAKKVVRVIRNGTNAVYDTVDSGIVKTKDIKDAMRNDIIDPAVQMLPVVSPIVGQVVDAGDAVADGALGVARGVVQSGRGLNDGLYEGVEKMLKKDKTCNC